MRALRYLRIGFEVLGVASFLLAHAPIIFIYLLGSDLEGVSAPLYWAAIAAGYLGMVAVILARRRLFPGLAPRALLDTWLLALPVALFIAYAMCAEKWPLRVQGFNAHGMGASGGEVNAALYPWLHGLIWILAARVWRRAIRAR